MHSKLASLIIPCLNEEGNIEAIYEQISATLKDHIRFELIYIDDGSTDQTLESIKQLSLIHPNVFYISFSRNFGHQYALKAGFDYANGDCVISLDADLQHPPELLMQLVNKWYEGYDIVYTRRTQDADTGGFKRITSRLFYKLMNLFSEIHMEEGVADFRLVDRKVADIFRSRINEYHLFYRGLISWVGYKQVSIPYVSQKRFKGESKYKFTAMLNFALNGITSFSIRPLRIAFAFGLLISLLSICYLFFVVGMVLFTDKTAPGWASVIVSVLFVGSIQLIFLGIVGEYLGKLFLEEKHRPHFLVQETNYSIHE